MPDMHITPTGSGRKDGSSWDNAATLSSLDKMVAAAGPGGEVLVRADLGAYRLTSSIDIKNGGLEGSGVTIRGVDGRGEPMNAEIIGTRAATWTKGAADGNEVLRLLKGADNLSIENLSFTNVKTAIRVGADIENLAVRLVTADNVQRFFENYKSGTNTTATISGLTIEDVSVHGFSKGVVRLQYDTHDVVIRNVMGDSERQDGDDFAMGVHLDGTVHDVLIKDTSMLNAHSSLGSYWNGDGFGTEWGVTRVRFENTLASGNTDGGYDLKSSDTVLIGAVADDNKRNFRIWSDSVTIIDSISLDPQSRGGSGTQAHVWVGKGAAVTLRDSVLLDNGLKTVGFDVQEHRAKVRLEDVDVALNAAARLTTPRGFESGVTNDDGSPVVALPWSPGLLDGLGGTSAPHHAPQPAPLPPAPPPPTIGVAAVASAVAEGLSGETALSFTVTRGGDLSKASSVAYTVAGDGPHGADAADFTVGTALSGTVSFAAGEAVKTVVVGVKGDRVIEQDEGVRVTLRDATGATLAPGAAEARATILNDDPTPTGLTAATRATASADLTTAGSQTVTAKAHHETFFVDLAARSGADVIKNFGSSDVLLTAGALHDGNKDGLIALSRSGVVALDGPKSADSIRFEGGEVTALRSLGRTDAGLSVYADAGVRPKGALEGTLGDDTLRGGSGDRASEAFFFDTALDLDLGDDRMFDFGAKDILVTTTRLQDSGGRVNFSDGVLDLPGGTGGAGDGYFGGEGGTVRMSDTDGRAITALEYDGAVTHDGVTYHVYSQVGSLAGAAQLLA